MYKVHYNTLAICDFNTDKESIGNVYQTTNNLAFTKTKFELVEKELIATLRKDKMYPKILKVERIEGIIY